MGLWGDEDGENSLSAVAVEAAEAEKAFAHNHFMECLNIAHQTQVLMYSRFEPSEVLARKLRAEMKKTWITHEISETQWLIEKHNSDPDTAGIGLVIADFDKTTPILMEFIKARESAPETKHLPTILIIMLMPPGAPTKEADRLRNSGMVANMEVLHTASTSSRGIFANVLDLVRKHHDLEGTYKELHRAQHNSKYPFLPIFVTNKKIAENEGIDDDDDSMNDLDLREHDDDYDESQSLDTSLRTEDDWTNASSMLPDFVKAARDKATHTTTEWEDDNADWRNAQDRKHRIGLDKVLGEKMREELQANKILAVPRRNHDVDSEEEDEINNDVQMHSAVKARGRAGRERSILVGHNIKPMIDRVHDMHSAVDKSVPIISKRRTSVAGVNAEIAGNVWASIKSDRRFIRPRNMKTGLGKDMKEVVQKLDVTAAAKQEQKEIERVEADIATNALVNKSKAKIIISKMAQESRPDAVLNRLIVIDFSRRKLAEGERAYLDRGANAVVQGDYPQALVTFERVLKKSKNPQLPMIAIGCVRFAQGKYIKSVQAFTQCLDYLSSLHESACHPEDGYIAYHNRALASFRIGDDQGGIDDMVAAMGKKDCIHIREMLIISLRRMGRYKDAIMHSTKLLEMQEEENEEELKRMAKAELKASAGKSSRPNTAKKAALQLGEILGNLAGSTIEEREEFAPSASGSVEFMDSVSTLKVGGPELTQEDEENFSATQQGSQVSSEKMPDISVEPHKLLAKKGERKKKHARPPSVVTVLDKKKHSFKDIKIDALANSKGGNNRSLDAFLVQNGFKESLHATLCTRLSPISEALVRQSKQRTTADLLEIVNTLRLVPFLYPLTDLELANLANMVDHISIPTKSSAVVVQNSTPGYVCIILEGTIQTKMVGKTYNTQYLPMSQLGKGEVFGHIDLLFMHSYKSDELKGMFRHFEGDKKDMAANDSGDPTIFERVVRPSTFATYSVMEPCQLLLVPQQAFKTTLHSHTELELRRRINIVEACGAFPDWTMSEKLRLVRMGTIKHYNQGTVVLKQGQVPDNLYLVMKGMLRVLKRQNRTELLERRLEDTQQQCDFHDLKYTFHHNLRHELAADVDNPYDSLKKNTHLTMPEVHRHQLGLEVQALQRKLMKVRAEQEVLEAEAAAGGGEEESGTGGGGGDDLEKDNAEIKVLEYPQLFGETVMTSPGSGTSRGTIVADTACEVFVIHKFQLQTFNMSENIMDRVDLRAVTYPTDDALMKKLEHKERWTQYKDEIMLGIPKGRWPTRADDVAPFV
jgi:CRP-like cAMP-binding protein/tetratricopeptide (TPR) repeat protein